MTLSSCLSNCRYHCRSLQSLERTSCFLCHCPRIEHWFFQESSSDTSQHWRFPLTTSHCCYCLYTDSQLKLDWSVGTNLHSTATLFRPSRIWDSIAFRLVWDLCRTLPRPSRSQSDRRTFQSGSCLTRIEWVCFRWAAHSFYGWSRNRRMYPSQTSRDRWMRWHACLRLLPNQWCWSCHQW